ncbi:hypothetical protein [Methanosalsum natronophilum]|uniref:Uncharacterized protein n=1 Tax=Methanosalsum natronophilum TaxID=768733 RepID=A0A3R7XI02_9EURY|nr:hypothetical protein [Methanosalsum natronophilum]MCS3923275.1 RsiW-degrading membrane proteinase PrsW (M82 family) [Methanosalsum natronophilum]RQD85172.1 MAG: hypothetical protein D5R95_05375 [Methanosalsum natronophilum]
MDKDTKINLDNKIYLYMIISAGIITILFYLMMRFADQGNPILVILMALLIGAVAFIIAKLMKHFYLKEL